MNEDAAFRAAIAAEPKDDLRRLVYADWLDENDRPAEADYLRTEVELARLPLNAPDASPLRERLWQAWAAVERAWLAEFTQPSLLRANPTPFPSAWANFDLGDLRPGDGTYDFWRYDTLPDLPTAAFRGDFQYLSPPPDTNPDDAKFAAYMTRFEAGMSSIAAAGIRVPNSYVVLMGSRDLRRGFLSATDCYFALLDAKWNPIRADTVTGVVRVPFYCDSQGCEIWDLYFHPTGANCVVARGYEDAEPVRGDSQYDNDMEVPNPLSDHRGWFVAPSFEAFVYRVWIENQIWYAAHGDALQEMGHSNARPTPIITPAIQAYIDHYRKP